MTEIAEALAVAIVQATVLATHAAASSVAGLVDALEARGTIGRHRTAIAIYTVARSATYRTWRSRADVNAARTHLRPRIVQRLVGTLHGEAHQIRFVRRTSRRCSRGVRRRDDAAKRAAVGVPELGASVGVRDGARRARRISGNGPRVARVVARGCAADPAVETELGERKTG